MYNDSTFNNLFTGYKSGSDYIYPEGGQNLVVKFTPPAPEQPFHLSALEGDFTTDPVTITSETGEGEDISIGNAPAKVMTATMLNPSNTMGSLAWGDGKVYIGCETATATADAYNSYPVHVLVGSVHYSIDSSGRPRRNSTTLGTLGGTGVAVISNSDGSDVLFISTTSIGRRVGGSYTQVTTPSASQSYLAEKFRAMPYTVGVLLDANGCPSVYNSVEKNTKQTLGYVPMGVFDFSGVDAYGITFGVEAYDKMTVFDADATEWWNSIDFTAGKQLQTLAGEVVSHYGLTLATLPGTAVNKTVSWTTNPITSYAVTGRDLLKWLGEAMGCNVRMGRTGTVEFWTFSSTAVASITPDIIVSSTRVVGRKSVPAVTQTVCYNVLGAGYTATGSTTTGTTYYVVANPFIDPSGSLASLDAIHGIVTAIPAYYPITIAVSCADARWDAGDFVTITDTDNNSITVPIMHQVMEWNGMCHATLSATGKQVRDIPESMLNTDLSSMVDSNPSAVVNKIMAKGITVYDSSNNVLFSAIGDDHRVEIGGFTVEDDKLTYSTSAGYVRMSNTMGFSCRNDNTGNASSLTDGIVSVSNDSSAETPFGTLRPERLNFDAASHYKSAIYARDGITLWENNVGDASLDLTNGLHIDDNANDVDVTPTSISITNGLATSTQTATGVTTTYNSYTTRQTQSEMTVTDGTNKTEQNETSFIAQVGSNKSTQNATSFSIVNSPGSATITTSGASFTDGYKAASLDTTGMTLNDGTASSTLSIISRTNTGSANSPGVVNITLGRGVYLAITTHTNNSTATQSGLAVVQAYDSNSSVREIVTAGNSTLEMTSATNLKWTVTNTYRALRLIKLT